MEKITGAFHDPSAAQWDGATDKINCNARWWPVSTGTIASESIVQATRTQHKHSWNPLSTIHIDSSHERKLKQTDGTCVNGTARKTKAAE